ncbi:hypothetical protein PIB30_029968 [Stylosanthes scabra]|uniref:Transposase (Putative), gypsy type n=1 Tax=Stylosanthes scabra TaxID=79078 RepID=A0ABU6XBM6_9FABA|nr:hypothetical protein [Stylosanthes scabra]
MGKKRSCQDVKVPRPLNKVETRLYGWVEEAVFTQPLVVESHSLPEFRRNFPLTEDSRMEGDYVLEAAGPSDRVPFRAGEGETHFLWVYKELFTRFGVRLPFSDFQRDVMTRCRVVVNQLHLNGWGFILTFEKNPEVKDFTVFNLEPLEMAAFKFLVSLPRGLLKRNKFTCRWILDNSDAEVGKFLDDLLDVKMKKTKLDNLMAMMAPHAILPTGHPSAMAVSAAASAAAAPASAASPTPAESSSQVPPEHDVDPVKVAFPESFNYRKALDAGLTSAPVREVLVKMPPEQLLGESYHLSARSLPCLQVGVETSLAAKVKVEKELSAALDQIEVLKGERDSALAFLPLKEKVDNLDDQLSERTTEYQSALERIAQLEEDNGVLKAQLESSQFSLEGENKRLEAAEKQAGSFAASLKTCQADLINAIEASEYWCAEWRKLGAEATEMCQETLDSRWDPKGRRIFVPRESDVEEEPPQAQEVVPEQRPEATTQASQPVTGDVAGASGACPT